MVMTKTVGEIMNRLTVSKKEINEHTQELEDKESFKIITTTDLRDELHEYYDTDGANKGMSLGWVKTDDFKIRNHEVTIVTGTNGSGKTMWLSQVCLNLLSHGTKCLIASLEMHPILTCTRMITQKLVSPEPTPQYVDDFLDEMEDKLYIYNQDGVTTTDDMYAMIEYASVLGCEIIVIDSLMKMSDIAEDNYDKQKRFIDRITVLAREYPIHIFVVAHTRKLTDFYAQPTKNDIHGSNHIANLTDNIIAVWRNKHKEKAIEDDKLSEDQIRNIPDAKVFVQKQRNYIGENGEPTYSFWYDKKGLRFKERP